MAEIEKDKNKKDVNVDINDLKDGDLTIKISGEEKKPKNVTSSKVKKSSTSQKTTQKKDNSQENNEEKKEENKSQNKENEGSEQEKANDMFKDQDNENKTNDDSQKDNNQNENNDGKGDSLGKKENGGANSGTSKQIDASSGSKLPTPNGSGMKLPGVNGGAGGGNPLTQGLKKGASNLGNAAKDTAKQAAKAAGKAIKEAAKKVAAAVAKAIVTNPYLLVIVAIIIVIVIIAAIIHQLLLGDSADIDIETTTASVEQMQTAINNGEIPGSIDQVNTALSSRNEYGSFIGFTGTQLDYLYNCAVDNSNVEASQKKTKDALIELYSKKYGREEPKSDGLLRVTDYRELYKHIMNTEKYNFNEIEWVNYNHDQNGSRVLTSNDMTVNRDLGIQYPNDSSMTAEKFMDLASPYLLSNYVPLSFLIAQSTRATGDAFESGLKSNEEILAEMGIENPSGYFYEDSISYQILKYGLSDITINQYQLKKYLMDTYYLDYNATDCHEEFEVTETKNYSYTIDENGQRSEDTVTSSSYVATGLQTKSETPVHHNTRWNDSDQEDVKLETVVSENPTYETIYYVTHAKAFDMEKNAEYTYSKYNDGDVTNRTNADSESVIDSEYNEIDNEGNRITSVANINSIQDIDNLGNKTSQTPTTTGTPNSTSVGTHRYTVTTVYKVVGRTYTKKEGKRYDISREWDDEVTPGNSDTKALNTNSLINFNKNEENDKDKATIDENTLKNHKDYSYYEDLATNKKLNVVDILDSNPNIFRTYTGASNRSEYVGYGRDSIYASPVYETLLNKYFDTIADSNKLKLAYGSSLGYEVSSGDSNNGSGSYGTAFGLMIQLLHEFEGGGTVYQNAEGVDCYKVLNVVGNMTVGYGIDITVNPQWKAQLEQQMGSSITFGTLVPCEYVDAIEEDFINRKLASIDATLSSNAIELKEYQKHALLIRMYNTGNISGFPNAYKSYFKEDVDDRYETTYEQYSSDPGNVSAITSCADLNSQLYNNYLSTPVTSNGQTLSGLITRRKEEYYLFSLGYYTHNNLHAFYSQGLSFNGINAIKPDGSVDLDACYQLQAALEDAVFDGKFHSSAPGMSNPWGQRFSTSKGDMDENGYLSDSYRSFFASSLYYQCPWWSRGRANIYLNSVNSEKFKGQFIRDGLGNGNNLAKGIANAYGVPFYTDLNQLTANCVISYGASAKWGHTAYVEAVGNDYYVISHCGSGVAWHGVSVVPKRNNGLGSGYDLVGFVKMDDIVSKYNN